MLFSLKLDVHTVASISPISHISWCITAGHSTSWGNWLGSVVMMTKGEQKPITHHGQLGPRAIGEELQVAAADVETQQQPRGVSLGATSQMVLSLFLTPCGGSTIGKDWEILGTWLHLGIDFPIFPIFPNHIPNMVHDVKITIGNVRLVY